MNRGCHPRALAALLRLAQERAAVSNHRRSNRRQAAACLLQQLQKSLQSPSRSGHLGHLDLRRTLGMDFTKNIDSDGTAFQGNRTLEFLALAETVGRRVNSWHYTTPQHADGILIKR